MSSIENNNNSFNICKNLSPKIRFLGYFFLYLRIYINYFIDQFFYLKS